MIGKQAAYGLGALAWLVAGWGATAHAAETGPTFEAVKKRGHLLCGIGGNQPGFAEAGADGAWIGLDVDVCRAVAVAIFGEADKVLFRSVASNEGLMVLRAGEIDLLSRGTNWTMGLEVVEGLRFAGVTFFDGDGLLVRRDLGIGSALELSGAKICLVNGTLASASLADFFKSRQMPFAEVAFDRGEDARKAYEERRCEAICGALSGLNSERLQLGAPDDHIILPEALSKEPSGPVVRGGDEHWRALVAWTVHALVGAEELGAKAATIDALVYSGSPSVRRLAGIEGDLGAHIGLDPQWAFNVVRAVGNYGEVFDRNLGPDSKVGLVRGFNRLWRDGGLMFAPALR